MAQLWALRDGLRRVASAEDNARAKQSETTQNIVDTGWAAAKMVGRSVASDGLLELTRCCGLTRWSISHLADRHRLAADLLADAENLFAFQTRATAPVVAGQVPAGDSSNSKPDNGAG